MGTTPICNLHIFRVLLGTAGNFGVLWGTVGVLWGTVGILWGTVWYCGGTAGYCMVLLVTAQY